LISLCFNGMLWNGMECSEKSRLCRCGRRTAVVKRVQAIGIGCVIE
jgi:hypothetical protein